MGNIYIYIYIYIYILYYTVYISVIFTWLTNEGSILTIFLTGNTVISSYVDI